jgi:hypothetical protein
VRILLFLAAFCIAVLLTAPLDRWVLDAARGPLATVGAELHVGSLGLALPAGLRAAALGIETQDAGITVDSLYVGLSRSFEADACGGHIRGQIGSESIEIDLEGVDLSRCLRVGKLALESPLEGSLKFDGIDVWNSRLGASPSARVDLTSSGGVFRGILEHAGQDGADLPLGEWEFSNLVLHASMSGGEVKVEEGHAVTNGVEWELLAVKAPSLDTHNGLRVDFRAKQVEDNPRSRALIGLMPKTAVDAGGWRNYRVTGSLSSPRVIAVD